MATWEKGRRKKLARTWRGCNTRVLLTGRESSSTVAMGKEYGHPIQGESQNQHMISTFTAEYIFHRILKAEPQRGI